MRIYCAKEMPRIAPKTGARCGGNFPVRKKSVEKFPKNANLRRNGGLFVQSGETIELVLELFLG
ncbi:MAG TPA: hypothetical protein VFS84_10060 [Candidatus Binatia bacterium]|nr:hypothetical protein [Candidatus Binatia bacterium]